MKDASTGTVEPTSLRPPDSDAVLHNAGAQASIASLWKQVLSTVQHKCSPSLSRPHLRAAQRGGAFPGQLRRGIPPGCRSI